MVKFRDFYNQAEVGMGGKNIGYLRVSSTDQNLDRQLDGLHLDRVFEEKASGKDTLRPVLQECLAYLRDGDVLHVHEISRLARNLGDLERVVSELTSRGVEVRFVKENLTFAGQEDPMARLMLQMLGAVSQFERALIRSRQQEGIQSALKRGQKFGRPEKLSEQQKSEIRAKAVWGDSKQGLADEYGVSTQLIYAVLKQGTVATEAVAKKISHF